jgi:hypothetical protein
MIDVKSRLTSDQYKEFLQLGVEWAWFSRDIAHEKRKECPSEKYINERVETFYYLMDEVLKLLNEPFYRRDVREMFVACAAEANGHIEYRRLDERGSVWTTDEQARNDKWFEDRKKRKTQ